MCTNILLSVSQVHKTPTDQGAVDTYSDSQSCCDKHQPSIFVLSEGHKGVYYSYSILFCFVLNHKQKEKDATTLGCGDTFSLKK